MSNYLIFADESCLNKHFMILSGIIINATNFDKINEEVNSFRVKNRMFAEIKWAKVSNQKYTEYKNFVDYIFGLINQGLLSFHAIIVDNHLVNNKKYNLGDSDIGFYKFFYQLLIHCFCKRYCSDENRNILNIVFDKRTTKYSLNDLKKYLNDYGAQSRLGLNYNPFNKIRFFDSKSETCGNLLQINDLLLGAVGFHKNGECYSTTSKKSKKDIANYIGRLSGIGFLGRGTGIRQNSFTIWNFKLRKK